MAIQNVSEETKTAIRNKSAQFLPNNPSGRGMTADQIRRAFYAPVTDSADSILSELDRVVGEANTDISKERESRNAAIEEAITQEQADRNVAIDAAGEKVLILADEKYAPKHSDNQDYEVWVSYGKNGGWLPLDFGSVVNAEYPYVPTYRTPNVGGNSVSGVLLTAVPVKPFQAANKVYVDNNIKDINDVFATRFNSLETAVSGKARSYVIEGLDALSSLLAGSLAEIKNADLITGDNILLRQKDVPDFWFEKTESGEAPTYTYVEYDENGDAVNETTYTLSVKSGGTQVGILHVLESDYTVIEGQVRSAGRAAEEATTAASEAQAAADAVGEALADYIKETDADEKYAPKHHDPDGGITRVWTSDGTNNAWIKVQSGGRYTGNGCFARFVGEGTGDEAPEGHLISRVPTRNYQVANKQYVDDTVGNIEAVLDSIIAMQESLIGGGV